MTESTIDCGRFDELFPGYLERELPESEMALAQAHVDGCARCRGLVRDIEAIRREADALPDMVPARDLWPGIESRIAAPVVSIANRRTVSIPRSALATAAAALIVVTSSITYVAATREQGSERPAAAVKTQPAHARPASLSEGAVGTPIPDAVLAVAEEIAALEALIAEQRNTLAPETVRVVEENLAIIDAAVAQAREAVERDPGSRFLHERLESALQKKIHLMKTFATLRTSA